MAKFEMKNAIQMGHLANIAALAASIPDGDKEIRIIGYVIGKVRGVTYRANPNGDEPSLGLLGMFEATPTEEGRATIRSGVAFLPTAYTKMIADAIRGDQDVPKKAPPKGKAIDLDGISELQLAVEIGIRKNTGAGVGYEFAVTQLTDDVSKEDALAEVRSFLPASIEKRSAPVALPAPAASAKKPAKRGKK